MRLFQLLSLAVYLFISTCSIAQVPGGINYQGVAMDHLLPFSNKPIGLRFTIRHTSATGTILYSETRQATTDSFGVFNVVIGGSGAQLQSGSIKSIPWSDTTRKFLQVEMDMKRPVEGTFIDMGTTQLLSVPFSFYSDISDSTRIAATSDTATFSKSAGRYYFSATIQPDVLYPISGTSDDLIKLRLPKVNFDEGRGFKPDSATFVAPDSGIYQFDFYFFGQAALLYGGNEDHGLLELSFFITRNDKVIKATGNFTDGYGEQSGIIKNRSAQSAGCRIKLAKGDRVAIKYIASHNGYSSVGIKFDTEEMGELLDLNGAIEFSGYKIK